jgi:DeoR/GlpR family transcriptional regulator of sugar metabolism
MLAQERLKYIVDLINEQNFVKVDEIAEKFGVSEMTVRRDLEKIRKSGIIRRVHGGAELCTENEPEQLYNTKSVINIDEKRRIAAVCSSLVHEGNTVFLDAGTTTYQIAESISTIKNLTFVTNDILIASMLFQRCMDNNNRIIVIGGEVQKSTGSLIGGFAQRMISEMRFDVAFIGSAAIDDNLDNMTPTIEKAFLKRLAAQMSAKSYLAVDSSKFGRRSMICINSLADYTAVVTDHVFTANQMRIINSRKINIIPVPKEDK